MSTVSYALSHLNSKQPYEIGVPGTPTLQIRKLRFREKQYLVPGHTPINCVAGI